MKDRGKILLLWSSKFLSTVSGLHGRFGMEDGPKGMVFGTVRDCGSQSGDWASLRLTDSDWLRRHVLKLGKSTASEDIKADIFWWKITRTGKSLPRSVESQLEQKLATTTLIQKLDPTHPLNFNHFYLKLRKLSCAIFVYKKRFHTMCFLFPPNLLDQPSLSGAFVGACSLIYPFQDPGLRDFRSWSLLCLWKSNSPPLGLKYSPVILKWKVQPDGEG